MTPTTARGERKYAPRKLPKEIVRLHMEGCTVDAIAKVLGCSRQNVRQVLERRQMIGREAWNRKVAELEPRHQKFLEREAARNHVTIDAMARALLVDAIEDAIAEEADRSCQGQRTTGSPLIRKTLSVSSAPGHGSV